MNIKISPGRMDKMRKRAMTRNGVQVQRGFTLVEIIIAVMILAVSLTTILGLQSSSTAQAIRTKNKQEAMLAAREIMAAIELQGATVENISLNSTVEEVLKKYLPPERTKSGKIGSSLPLRADLSIDFWATKGLPDKSVKKVALVVYWSDNPQDKISIIYFVPL